PQSLLDNSPMQALLARVLDFDHLQSSLESGALSALAITASGYTSGEHLTFYQAHTPIEPWHRYLRLAIPTPITV
ncbi:patatin-like phospholipase family protein, partial [Achromobacter xylosoxidans]